MLAGSFEGFHRRQGSPDNAPQQPSPSSRPTGLSQNSSGQLGQLLSAKMQPSQPVSRSPSPEGGTDSRDAALSSLSPNPSAQAEADQALLQSESSNQHASTAQQPSSPAGSQAAAPSATTMYEDTQLKVAEAAPDAASKGEPQHAPGRSLNAVPSAAASSAPAAAVMLDPQHRLPTANDASRDLAPAAPPVANSMASKVAGGSSVAAEPAGNSVSTPVSSAAVLQSQGSVASGSRPPAQEVRTGQGQRTPQLLAAATHVQLQPAEAVPCESERGGLPGESAEERAVFYESLQRHWRQEAKDDFVNNRCAPLWAPA